MAFEYEELGEEYQALRNALMQRWDDLLDRVHYREGYEFRIGITSGMKYPYVQIRHLRPDNVTGEYEWGQGGKAYPSQHATDSEFFQLLLGLAKAYEEHEVREFFQVDGTTAFGPHMDVNALVDVAHRLDVRP